MNVLTIPVYTVLPASTQMGPTAASVHNSGRVRIARKVRLKSFGPRGMKAWAQGYKTFSSSTQLSMKFQLLLKTKMLKNKDLLSNSQMFFFYHANKCCWHFNIYEPDNFMLS